MEAGRVVVAKEELDKRIAELGAQISSDYKSRDLLLLGILKGSVVFLTELMRHITVPHKIDFISVSSYGVGARESSGLVHVQAIPDIAGYDVLIVEDIIDTGYTLDYLKRRLLKQNPASLRICCLLDKTERRKVIVPIDYRGFSVPNVYLVGFGLDADEYFRNLPYVAELEE